MTKEITIGASLVGIPEDTEGAARLLAHVAKPTNHSTAMKKLRDFVLTLEGETPPNNRSREQVRDAASVVWTQLRRAIEVGDWFDRMFAASPAGRVDSPGLNDYARTLVSSIGGSDKQVVWKPYLPIVHLAAGFRIAMLKTRRGRFFNAGSMPRAVQLDQLRDLLWEDHGWIRLAIDQAQARLVLHRLHARHAPGTTRMFVLTGNSQECPPHLARLTSRLAFAERRCSPPAAGIRQRSGANHATSPSPY